MRSITLLLPLALLLMLGSCSSPPKPPTVDESNRRPANSAMAVDLQACKSELYNTQIAMREAQRMAEINSVNEARVAALQQAMASVQARWAALPANTANTANTANSVFMLRFDFGSVRVEVPADLRAALLDSARAAPWVVLRGRTDGEIDNAAEGHIASARAAAVRDYLVSAGVDAHRIHVSHQAVGDHVADNQTPAGRALNRRVEVELYRAVPVALH
ncbi:OmpA family protein [Roseateles sp. GG27B]